ncbi:MAG: hypothetical protein COC24_019005 [Alphaproteobacteria bacterium]|nr:hypothetical protein [Alphaproteobacteria bacterium]
MVNIKIEYELQDPLDSFEGQERTTIFNELCNFIDNSKNYDILALSMLPTFFQAEDSGPFIQERTYNEARDFAITFYLTVPTGDFFENKSGLRNFITRKSETPLSAQNKNASPNVMAILLLFMIALRRSKVANLITEHRAYKTVTANTQIFKDAEDIIADPEGAKKNFGNRHMDTMRSFANIAKEAFNIEDMASHFMLRNFFKNSEKERNFLMYRYGTRQKIDQNPYLVKSFLKLKPDLSTTVRMLHFYKDKTETVRRTNGGIIELNNTIYMFGASSKITITPLGEPALSEALGLKLIAIDKTDIMDNKNAFSAVVLSNERDYYSLVGRIAIIETNANHSDDAKIGTLSITKLKSENALHVGDDIDIQKMLEIDTNNKNFAIKATEYG